MRFDPKVSRAKLPRRSTGPTPAWRRILSTRWFPYLVVLPVGVVIILVVSLTSGGDDGPPDPLDPRDFPVQSSIGALLQPQAGEIPDEAQRLGSSHGFLARLPQLDAFAIWDDYVQEPRLIAFDSWLDVDGEFVSLALYPALDEELAVRAFAALREANQPDLMELVVPRDGTPRVFRSLETLDFSAGDESHASIIAFGGREAVTAEGGIVPEREVWTYWVRVEGVILVGARTRAPGAQAPLSRPIDLQAVLRAAAERIAAFNPATDIPADLLPAAQDAE